MRHRSPSTQGVVAAIIVLVASAYGLSAAPQDSLSATLQGLQKRYASVNAITGRFQQNYRAPGIEQNESGVFWMKKPGLMRWEYRDPEQKLFVADGRETFLYTPADRQVLVRKFNPSELHSTPLQFLLGQGDLLRSFTASRETQLKPKLQGTVLLRLVPSAAEADYSHLVLEVDPGTFDIRRILIQERTGNTSEFVLTDVATNVRIENRQFQFKAPKGVELVRLDEK